MMTSRGNEVLHVALGDVACAITTHWQALQFSEEDEDPSITHATYQGRYVPRSLLVGTMRSSFAMEEEVSKEAAAAAWSGPIETMVLRHSDTQHSSVALNLSPPRDVLPELYSAAASSNWNSWDRYRVSTSAMIAPKAPTYASQGRQVNWDDEEEEEDMEEEESNAQSKKRYTPDPEPSSSIMLPPATPMEDSAPILPPSSNTTWYDQLRQAPWHPHLTCMEAEDWNVTAFHDALWDRVRLLLEACDQTPGLWLLQEDAAAASIGTHLLHTWQEECARAPGATAVYLEATEEDASTTTTAVDNQRKKQQHCADLRHLCVVAEQTAAASLWMPLQCPSDDTRHLARALECATLSYRRPKDRAALAFRSLYDATDETRQEWTYRDFRRALQRHATSRNVLELDALLPDAPFLKPLSWLQPGTSVERDAREKSRLPANSASVGDWMNGTSNDGAVWTSWTPQVVDAAARGTMDRNLHYHYALSASLRHTPISTEDMPKYVTSIMESMGIRYRPEQALCTVVGATAPSAPTNALAVLGNTTRIYTYLHARATVKIPSSLASDDDTKMERDDLVEAQMACLDLRDSYAPPRGSGLVAPDDENETYFEG